jgi:hypothetical protein
MRVKPSIRVVFIFHTPFKLMHQSPDVDQFILNFGDEIARTIKECLFIYDFS